ncbi:MAG: 4Fe-4S dicluster domain-containing protein [Candidatus Omnitrophota bacterium]
MRYPKLRELKEAVLSFLSRPYTTSYPTKKHVAAKGFRGKPTPSSNCIGCMACIEVCPARAIEAKDTLGPADSNRVIVWHLDECHYCGQCELNCTTRQANPPGVRLTGEYELAGFKRCEMVSQSHRQALALCELCGTTITTHGHLDWILKRLGPLGFSNPTIFISALKEIGLADEIPKKPQESTRADRIKVLCAKCRRGSTQEK